MGSRIKAFSGISSHAHSSSVKLSLLGLFPLRTVATVIHSALAYSGLYAGQYFVLVFSWKVVFYSTSYLLSMQQSSRKYKTVATFALREITIS